LGGDIKARLKTCRFGLGFSSEQHPIDFCSLQAFVGVTMKPAMRVWLLLFSF
jgi:hypothetical protein